METIFGDIFRKNEGEGGAKLNYLRSLVPSEIDVQEDESPQDESLIQGYAFFKKKTAEEVQAEKEWKRENDKLNRFNMGAPKLAPDMPLHRPVATIDTDLTLSSLRVDQGVAKEEWVKALKDGLAHKPSF